jgi:hypothetical protein
MENKEKKTSGIEKAAEDLFDFAVDHEDAKWLMEHLPQEADIERGKVEYELRMLKIISVGWSLSYYLENHLSKHKLLELYWQAVNQFSESISATTGLMVGRDIDYFQILKERLDMYVAALAQKPDAPEPAVVIGPEFARTCGNADDIFTVMTGSKMFIVTIGRVKEYLEAIELT